ncbi:PDR/VanB family oxidoreductase [Nocardioides acrostichi]|uniref:Oxidoreductase n=1 Tax=Nocardioides acrostichi TaxID=2784339 RepID=A0A930UX01_9ACTN|nr:PDR/VanB family oxidoreductase [Nocardioides acrostichi]MBF4162418.1 oxidoreductase [Nocardioides acrostichi]
MTHRHPGYRTGTRIVRVADVRDLTDSVRHLRLVADDGLPLAGHEPGSHLVLTTRGHDGEVKHNAYSLTGDGVLPGSYAISVLHKRPEQGGTGGSSWMHALGPGDLVEVSGPRSAFAPRHDQRHALLVAGGIGVTPVLSHLRAIVRWGGTAEVLYSYRPGHAAHLDDLRELATTPGITLHEATTVEGTTRLLADRFADQPLGSHAYACGPPAMLDAYLEAGRAAGWPEERLHLERFAAPELDPGSPFTVRLADDRALDVPAGTSLLAALLDAGVDVPNLCRQGVCGECVVPLRGGEVEHRDLVLSDDERAAGDRLASCVSRGAHPGAVIEVDLP